MLIRAFIFYLFLWVFVMIIGGTQQASGLFSPGFFPAAGTGGLGFVDAALFPQRPF